MSTHLLLAEDTRDLNRALVTILEHEGYKVSPVYDGEEALRLILTETFDGIILDIMMPKRNGLEVLRELRVRGIVTPVLLLTAKAEVDDRVIGLDAGADDYLTKPFAMKELLARVRSMTRRRGVYGAENLSFGDVSLDAETFELSAGNAVRLSVKEFELMQMLVRNCGRGLTYDYLLGHVWHGEDEADADTVELYVSYLRGKLKWVGSSVTVVRSEAGFELVAGDADAAGPRSDERLNVPTTSTDQRA
ncbi:MAG: response regulator transcription factor [Atopobiaceae bacterium]|nr:response regulator transcription factor [Atopobiaceae bacterium]